MTIKPTHILFIGKKDNYFSEIAKEYILQLFPDSKICLSKRGEQMPDNLSDITIDYIVSFLSQWVLPEKVLKKANKIAINFHPAPPEYPGIGCTNFALYNNETIFGVTCHEMLKSVDSGRIIRVKRFPILKNDTVFSLTQKSYAYMLTLFYEVISEIVLYKKIDFSDEGWHRKPYTRKELNALCKITSKMSIAEIKRRVKATTFPGAQGAYIKFDDLKFEYKDDMVHN